MAHTLDCRLAKSEHIKKGKVWKEGKTFCSKPREVIFVNYVIRLHNKKQCRELVLHICCVYFGI